MPPSPTPRPTRLLSWLLGLEPSPLHHARLAWLYFLMGQVEAAEALQTSRSHPLLTAARLQLLSVRCQYPQILHLAATALPGGPAPLAREAAACIHYQVADARLYLYRYAEGAWWAEQAARAAKTCGMVHLAQVCELLAEECSASREENTPPRSANRPCGP